jgi:hypothetical protein
MALLQQDAEHRRADESCSTDCENLQTQPRCARCRPMNRHSSFVSDPRVRRIGTLRLAQVKPSVNLKARRRSSESKTSVPAAAVDRNRQRHVDAIAHQPANGHSAHLTRGFSQTLRTRSSAQAAT